MSALTIDVDGGAVPVRLDTCRFPGTDAMRRGEGTIRLQSAAALPQLSNGPHHLRFRNRHHPEGSVYLANALVPGSADVAITAQRRDGNQTELTIDYELRGSPSRSTATVLLGSLTAAAMLVVLWMRRTRAAR
jgi:hypothetical protein